MANMNLRSSLYERRRDDPDRLIAAIDKVTAAGWTTAEAAALLEAAVVWEPEADGGVRSRTMQLLCDRLRRLLTVERSSPSTLLDLLRGMKPAAYTRRALEALPPAAKAELDRMALADATGESIALRMAEIGIPISRRRAVAYKKRVLAEMDRSREARTVAGAWADALSGSARGEIGRLLQEMLKTVAFQTLAAVGEDGTVPDAKELAELAKAVREVAAAEQITTELELRLRRELAESLAPKLAAAERAVDGRPADLKAALARIREEVYGLTPDSGAEP